MPSPSVLIVAEHASFRFGGEAALPLHYFRVLHRRQVPVRLITHSRVRDELQQAFPEQQHLITYVEDGLLHKAMWRAGRCLPERLSYFTTGFASRLCTQLRARKLARQIVQAEGVSVVHQPMPVSPREPTLLRGLGAPVVIGPMNGNMDYPEAFRQKEFGLVRLAIRVARRTAGRLTRTLLPGKLEAAALLVANDRTRSALPPTYRGRVYTIPENGVDLQLWKSPPIAREHPEVCRCVFIGRLVDVKAVDQLVAAFLSIAARERVSLTIVGDGPEKVMLAALVRGAGALAGNEGEPGRIFFAGWRTQPQCAEILGRSDVLVLPSLRECGGAVILEAMAVGLPVIATDWGGPADYLDADCGILVAPASPARFRQDLAAAIARVAADPGLRRRMGACGRDKVARLFDWERKADQLLAVYREVAG